jgi:hypothetical protein
MPTSNKGKFITPAAVHKQTASHYIWLAVLPHGATDAMSAAFHKRISKALAPIAYHSAIMAAATQMHMQTQQ